MHHRLSLPAVLLTLPLIANAWQPGGVPVCTDPANQGGPCIAKTTDGFVVGWTDARRGNNDIFSQKLDGLGSGLWTLNGNPVCDHDSAQWNPIVIDGVNGGALFFFEDPRNQYPPWPDRDIWGQRFNRNGGDVWVHNGRIYSVYNSTYRAVAIPDGSGGALLVENYSQPPDASGLHSFHMDSLGVSLWNQRIGTESYFGTGAPQIVSDGSGGAVIGWYQTHQTLGFGLYAQRVTLSGQVLWASAGVRLIQFSDVRYDYPKYSYIRDATHGAIVTWADSFRTGNFNIFAQRVSGDSVVRWQTNGVPVRVAPGDQANPKAVPDGQGGAIVVWEDGASGLRDIYAQRVDSTGARLWDTLGVPVIRSTGDQTGIQMVSDEAGRVIVTWKDNRNGNNDIYAQRLNPNGQRLWDTLGVQICVWNGEQTAPVICQDGSGGAVIVWQDTRNGNNDIYAQRISASGSGVWEEPVPSRLTPYASRLSVSPNPFISYTSVPSHSSDRFALYAISGRKVGVYKGDRVGGDVPPGVYFLRPIVQGGKPLRLVKVR